MRDELVINKHRIFIDSVEDQSYATVAAADGAVDISAVRGNTISVTGSGKTITTWGASNVGARRCMIFAGVNTLDNSIFLLPGGGPITTAANDTAEFVYLGLNGDDEPQWICIAYRIFAGGEVADTSGLVSKADYTDDQSVLVAVTNSDPQSLPIGEDRILGRKTGDDVSPLTLSEVLDMVGSAANGDILVRSGGVWTRLAKGTDGQVLTIVAGAPAWA